LQEGFGEVWRGNLQKAYYAIEGLMDNSGGISESQNADKEYGGKDYVDESSDGNENSIGNLTRDYSCYFLAKNIFTFGLCPETVVAAEVKGDGLLT
jgi:hypothetical protein